MISNHHTIKVLPTLLIAGASMLWQQPLMAQISHGGQPYSFSSAVTDSIATRTMAALDVATLVAEDELEAAQDLPVPPRFGYAFKVSLGPDSSGTWIELPNGDWLWRLRIITPGAYSINLLYNYFWLPAGAKFFIYNEDRSMVLGSFTSANNKDHGKFSTGLVRGDISILEYYEPAEEVMPETMMQRRSLK